jgi:drug/metabolite transporter (DMT)-like permease
MKTFGIVLVVLGIVMMIITGVNVITKEKVVDVGPLEINKEEKTPINWSPILGVVLLIGGVAVMALDKKRA